MSADLSNLLVQASIAEVNEKVKAEDLVEGSKIEWEKIFFEPEAGKNYVIKFLPNIDSLGGGKQPTHNIVHRSYFNSLPDPERRGKTFSYIAPQGFSTKDNLLMSLFFDLNDAKKQGDVVAEKKIEKYLTRKQQACVKVQIIKAPDEELIGKIMLFRFHTYGMNAHIANLINQRINPSKSDIEEGFVKENIFDIFDSPVMSIQCEKSTFQGKEGRDMSKSKWAMKRVGDDMKIVRLGATVFMPDDFEGEPVHKFSKNDLNEDGTVKDEVKPYLEELAKQISDPEISTYRFFEPRTLGDPRNTPEDEEYIKKNIEKVMIVREKIRNCSLEELSKLGEVVNDGQEKSDDKDNKSKKSILEDSIPDDEIPEELSDIQEGVKGAKSDKKHTDNKKVTEALADDDLDDF